jgi:hypothetical protein
MHPLSRLLAALAITIAGRVRPVRLTLRRQRRHAGQPVLLNEHRAMLDLGTGRGSDEALLAASGRWSDRGDVEVGKRPAAGAIVLIPKDVTR